MKEKLQEYALIAEIISAVAVVAGLIFVGLQIRQSTEQDALSTRALEAAVYQDLVGQNMTINNLIWTDKELTRIVEGGRRGALTDPLEESQYGRPLSGLDCTTCGHGLLSIPAGPAQRGTSGRGVGHLH